MDVEIWVVEGVRRSLENELALTYLTMRWEDMYLISLTLIGKLQVSDLVNDGVEVVGRFDASNRGSHERRLKSRRREV